METCRGCGKELDIHFMDERARFLCARCFCQMEVRDVQKNGGKPEVWSRGGTVIGLFLLAMACAIPSILYGLGSGHTGWGTLLGLSGLAAAGTPAFVVLRKGFLNIRLYAGLVFLFMGLWILLWLFPPDVEKYLREGIAAFGTMLLLAGSILVATFFRAILKYPRI